MSGRSDSLTLLTLGGVFTAPNFLDEFRESLRCRGEESGLRIETAATIMPYGDWTEPRLRQAAEIVADMVKPIIGGRRAAAAAATLHAGGELALLGHSGGGVAAAYAAAALMAEGAKVRAVVMIGSPKVPLPERVRDIAAWLYAEDSRGRLRDPIARAGSWRGRPPALRAGVQLIGGHKDYFRSRPPFISELGASNLSLTTEAALSWLLAAPSSRV